MFFQTSPILPQASGLGFVFDNPPWVRQMARHGAYPFLTGPNMGIHSGVRRLSADISRVGGQRRTSWVYGTNGFGDTVAQPALVVDPAVTPPSAPASVSADEAAQAVAGAATGGFLAGGLVAALPAAAVGLLIGYFVWGASR